MLIYKCKLKYIVSERKKVNTMTRIENFERIITLVEDVEVIDFCKAEIEKIKASNARKKSATSEKRKAENEPIIKAITDFLKGKDFTLASEIAKGCDISTQKVTALLKQMNVEVRDVKVPKVGIRKAYKLV